MHFLLLLAVIYVYNLKFLAIKNELTSIHIQEALAFAFYFKLFCCLVYISSYFFFCDLTMSVDNFGCVVDWKMMWDRI